MRKKLGHGIVVILLLFFFFTPYINAETDATPAMDTIQKQMQNLIKSVEIRDYEQAKKTVELLSIELTSIPYKGMTTVEGMDAIASTTIQLKRHLTSLSPNTDQIAFSTTQLQLAIDAMNHKEQPLWQRYYSTIRTDLYQIEKILSNNQTEKFDKAFEQYLNHYQLIRPAIQVSKLPYVVEKIDSLHTALMSQKVDQNKEVILAQLQDAIGELFYGDDKNVIGKVVEQKTLWNTTIGMSFVIFIALSYVLWKKFRGTRIRIGNE